MAQGDLFFRGQPPAFLRSGKDRVFLSVYDDNQGAIRLYEKLGFAFNGELDTKGERVMVYTVPRPNAPTEREERERAHDRSV